MWVVDEFFIIVDFNIFGMSDTKDDEVYWEEFLIFCFIYCQEDGCLCVFFGFFLSFSYFFLWMRSE